jgi:hypothetical protein
MMISKNRAERVANYMCHEVMCPPDQCSLGAVEDNGEAGISFHYCHNISGENWTVWVSNDGKEVKIKP